MTTITQPDFEERSHAEESDEDLSSVHSGDSAPYVEAKKTRAARRARWVKDTEEDKLETAEAAYHARLAAERAKRGPCSWSCLKLPGKIVPEAFDSEPNRVPRQIASATGLSLHLVMKTFDEVLDNPLWRDRQQEFTRDELKAFAANRKMSLYIFHGSKLVFSQPLECPTHEAALVVTYWSGAWYFLKSAGNSMLGATCNNKPPRTAGAILVTSLRRPPKEEPCVNEFPWGQDLSAIPAGTYWVHSMDTGFTSDEDLGHTMQAALQLFVESNRFPLLNFTRFPAEGDAIPRLTSFTYHKTAFDGEGQIGSIVVKSVAADAAELRAWAQKLRMQYGGQSLGSLAVGVLDTLLRRRTRQQLSPEAKCKVQQRQGHKCAACDEEVLEPEFDHTVPLCKGGKDDLENIQMLCKQCHALKSRAEGRAPLGYLKSRFNRDVYDKYLMSPKPPCMNFKDPGLEEYPTTKALITAHMAVDVIGSRYNALYQATELPVFTPLDDIEPITPDKPLPDLVYVDKPFVGANLAKILQELPYHGPGWYSKVAIEYCLHTHKLLWDDLRYGISASGHVPGDEVCAALDAMEAAWGDVPLNNPNAKPMKRTVNSMVGVFGMSPGGTRVKCWMSFEDEGVKHRGFQTLTDEPAFGLTGLRLQRTVAELRDPSSYRPLYDLCLCTEHVRLAQCHQVLQAVYKIQRLPPAFLAATTDGIIWTKPRKRVTAELMKAMLEGMTFEVMPREGPGEESDSPGKDPRRSCGGGGGHRRPLLLEACAGRGHWSRCDLGGRGVHAGYRAPVRSQPCELPGASPAVAAIRGL